MSEGVEAVEEDEEEEIIETRKKHPYLREKKTGSCEIHYH